MLFKQYLLMCRIENMVHERNIPYGGMLSWGKVTCSHDFLEIILDMGSSNDPVQVVSVII
ncbi:hypothetical protein JT06_00760 [Desulfobulbus sp. Tol-SR]|nr:hypothetical protein JT06_00760 [Desulfobulbus sp. Tol-SR]